MPACAPEAACATDRATDTIEYRKVAPGDGALIAALVQRAYDGRYPVPEFTRADALDSLIASGRHEPWLVATLGGEAIGTACSMVEPSNQSFEVGRVAVDPKYQSLGIAKQLTRLAIEAGFDSGMEVLDVHLRNEASYRLSVANGLVINGYLPGIVEIRSAETFLTCYRLSPHAIRARRSAAGSPIYNLPAVQTVAREIGIGLDDRPSPYPSAVFAGPPPSAAEAEVEIVLRGQAFGNRAFVAREAMLRAGTVPLTNLRFIQVEVLADKWDAILWLQRFGFRMVGFLPAWVERDGERFDAVRMVNASSFPPFSGEEGGRHLARLVEGFGNARSEVGCAGRSGRLGIGSPAAAAIGNAS